MGIKILSDARTLPEAEQAKTYSPRIGWLILALLIVQGSALGLKAWEERQSADFSTLAVLQRTSVALSERLNGRFETVAAVIQSTGPSAVQLNRAAERLDGVDQIATLRTAASSPSGSRLRVAAELALRATGSEDAFILTPDGDVGVVLKGGGQTPLLAIGPVTDWLPISNANDLYVLVGQSRVSVGNSELRAIGETLKASDHGFVSAEGSSRAAVSCTALTTGATSICIATPSPLIGHTDILRLLIYALLLIAPALAIYGLYALLTRQTVKVQAALKTEQEASHVFDLVMEGARAGFWESWVDTCDATISEQFAVLIEAPEAGLINADTFLEYVYEKDRETVQTALRRLREIGMISVAFRTSKSAGQRWVELSGRRVQDENPRMRCAGIASDITKRKSIDERLKTAERRLRNAIEGFDGPFAIWDPRRRLLYWNGAYAQTFSLTKDLRAGMGYDTVALARAPSIRQETPSETEPNTHLIHLVTGKWIKHVERPTPEGGLISIGIDVTDTTLSNNQLNRQKQKLKRLVEELERSEGHAAELARKYAEEKDRAERAAHSKSTFLANMSHELRTPLNAINGFSEILTNELYGPLGDQRYKGYASDILVSGQHLLDMINDILDMAKIEAGKMTIRRQLIDPIDPVDAAVRMIGRRAEDAGIRLIFDAGDNLPDIEADHRAIKQMVLNLISNAIKFTDSGGRIAVTLRRRDSYIRVAVTDTGVGIAASELPRLAQPFEQVNSKSDRNFEGTGLGLALTKSFAEMHGGKLTIASEEGRGTTVAFYLPIADMARNVA
ncbi:MAG: ATP-binding protein [Pseudomonadota bacterium]